MLHLAEAKQAALIKDAEDMIRAKELAARGQMSAEAAQMVRLALTKVVEMNPKDIDEALIKKAVAAVKAKWSLTFGGPKIQ